jgi:hypothetical protein
MNKKNKAAVILMVVLFASGCANSNLGDAAATGVIQTIKTQKKSDRAEGNSQSSGIEKESFINGTIAFVFCLFSSSEECKSG